MTEAGAYGEVLSPADAEATGWEPVEEPSRRPTATGDLWAYHNAGRVFGVPVRESDRGLKIGSEELLQQAFVLRRAPKSLMLYLSPDDTEAMDKYEAVLSRIAAGECELVDEERQFDAAHSRFLVWLRYNELSAELNPRFDYIREE
ncbi:MAG: hypothetical protein IJJ33_07585 [Victivallales bacterium]|nr:hypothetical protein [Victivallales bacterium]